MLLLFEKLKEQNGLRERFLRKLWNWYVKSGEGQRLWQLVGKSATWELIAVK